MADKRPALGRGLSALIPSAPSVPAIPPPVPVVATIPDHADPAAVTTPHRDPMRPVELDLDLLMPNPRQPRTTIDESRLDELAQSIRSNGVIQPVVVRRAGDRYEIVAGERRWRA